MTEKKFLIDYTELVEEWYYEKNVDLDINALTHGSHKRAWWKCSVCSHIWDAIIKSRARLNRGCPQCAGKTTGSLEKTNPELEAIWDFTKNPDIKNYTAGMHKKVWWKCKRDHAWEAKIFYMIRRKEKGYCLDCRMIDNNRFLSPEESPNLFSEWDLEKNAESFTSITKGTDRKFWWKCNAVLDHSSYSARPHDRLSGKGCPICAGRKQTAFIQDFPHLIDEWYDEENIENFTSGSTYIAQWKCHKGHVYKESIMRKAKNNNCAVCVKRIFKPFYSDDVALLDEWDYKKNNSIILYPENVSAGSHKKAWWNCLTCNHSWQSTIYSYCKGSRCVKCWARTRSSKGEIELANFVENICDNRILRNEYSLIYPYELDIYIPDLNLAFEFNGDYWHSDEVIRERSGISADEYHNRKVKMCADKGVELFFVWESEWAENNDNTKVKVSEIINERMKKHRNEQGEKYGKNSCV